MASAKKLPSGQWRVRIFVGVDANGKQIRKSFTADNKKKAEFLASQYQMENHTNDYCLTFEKALDDFINNKSSILSPSTIKEYRRSQEKDFDMLNKKALDKITQEDIQRFVNEKAKTLSPKSVRNKHSLIVSVFEMYRPNYKINTVLPQKIVPDYNIPVSDDIKKMIDSIKDDDLLIAVLLASIGSLRRSEIAALRSEDIDGNIAHIKSAMVLNQSNEYVIKTTKTVSSDRYVELPNFLIDLIKDREGYVCPLNPTQITGRYKRMLKRCGLTNYRFHDLRHYSASMMHAMGIPDAYIMKRGGWSTDRTLKEVYRHALDDESKKMNNKINNYFENNFNRVSTED